MMQGSLPEDAIKFRQSVYGDELVPKPAAGKKRPAGGGGGGGAKKPKIDPDSLTKDKMKEMIADDSIQKLTNDNLKSFLPENNLPVSGTKAVLVQRVKDLLK
ncbi:unnamed protein product [Vitrella brassicaformis CCMP3155]|uniref:SAP domain-containing protein n=1 Tax=Vitrella brassicaformis (strain CCMP3155) TaxID=1169540 RepID=A0A0G4E9R8_VITBC|nr:unnamed protein product [Vitrella brassicaformis CCMP3155]|eukprot:CEL91927.1 unnamed protein product [Vitrella brassicaformis CCMP3155]